MEQKSNPNLLYELGNAVFNTDIGKRFLEELKTKFLNVPIWAGQPNTDLMIYFREGQRHMVLEFDRMSKQTPKE